ncbi:uncharacterized protein PF3D7_1120000-like [Procambarus clarkii]|uniref:uncharacterized protein PF3D7_1120000-like n=1 Tax=Procambarus clarkii TaxID=6728 RepID=UPI003743DBF4
MESIPSKTQEKVREDSESEFRTLKGSIPHQVKKITALTDKVKRQKEQIKELVKDNEIRKVKSDDFEEINKKIDSYSEQLQGHLRANIELSKDKQKGTHIEEVNKELEKYKEEIKKKKFAQVVKERDNQGSVFGNQNQK